MEAFPKFFSLVYFSSDPEYSSCPLVLVSPVFFSRPILQINLSTQESFGRDRAIRKEQYVRFSIYLSVSSTD